MGVPARGDAEREEVMFPLAEAVLEAHEAEAQLDRTHAALHYDLRDLQVDERSFPEGSAAVRMWHALMNTWNVSHGRESRRL